MLARGAMTLVSGALLPGCLTQNIQFEPPRDYPPSIETPDTAQFPLNSVIRNPEELREDSDGGTGPMMNLPLVFLVRDPNVDQRLDSRVYVDFDPSAPRITEQAPIAPVLPTVEDRLTRRVTVNLPTALFAAEGCHRIEVFVSSAFATGVGRAPVTPGDIGTAVWWVATDANNDGQVEMTGCP